MAFYSLEPRGEQRTDEQIAMLAALTANIHRDAKKQPQPYRTEQFRISKMYERPKPLTPEELEAQIDAAFAALGGTTQ